LYLQLIVRHFIGFVFTADELTAHN